MKLRCSIGILKRLSCARYKTDLLWLQSRGNRDYLVCRECKEHREYKIKRMNKKVEL